MVLEQCVKVVQVIIFGPIKMKVKGVTSGSSAWWKRDSIHRRKSALIKEGQPYGQQNQVKKGKVRTAGQWTIGKDLLRSVPKLKVILTQTETRLNGTFHLNVLKHTIFSKSQAKGFRQAS